MIRKRDFLLFTGVMLFLLFGITFTWLSDLPTQAETPAVAIASLADGEVPAGATVASATYDRGATVTRLRDKLAAGQGTTSAGGPVFTSVDTMRAAASGSTSTVVTDQTAPGSILVGQTMDGSPLMSDDAWRFVGWHSGQQIGVALDGFPIFGLRPDDVPLDECGGFDDGSGYKYYLRIDKDFTIGCYQP